MKSLLAVLVLLASVTSSASFVKSDYLYGVKKRHAQMVNNDGESFIDYEYQDHGKWVDTKGIIEDHKWIGYMGHDVLDLVEDNRWEDINDYLSFEDEPYYCETLVEDYWHTYDVQGCKFAVQELLGDALHKADAVKMVFMRGDYYGDWDKTLVILSDYETKETVTLVFDILHEI